MSKPNLKVQKQSLAAVFRSVDKLDLQQITIPEPADGEAIVRISYCTLCGSDLHTFSGKRQEPTPSILGHEIVGVVEQTGPVPPVDEIGDVIHVGDRVTWSICVSCGECSRCQSGMPQKCEQLFKYGHALATGREALSGGLAEHILLRRGTNLFKLSPSVPDPVASPVNCATATVAATLRSAGETTNRRVLIFGAGMLGLTAAAMLKCRTGNRIVLCDPDEKRLARAAAFGSDEVVSWTSNRIQLIEKLRSAVDSGEYDLILELSGSSAAIEAAVEVAAIAARIQLVGSVFPGAACELNAEQVVRRWLTIQGVHNYAPCDMQTAIEFIEQQHTDFPFSSLVEKTFPLSSVQDAFDFALQQKPIRVAVIP